MPHSTGYTLYGQKYMDCLQNFVHKARSVKGLFSQFGVEEFDWPAQSLDLNPI